MEISLGKKPSWRAISLCVLALFLLAFRMGSTAWAEFSQRRILKVTAPILEKGNAPGQFLDPYGVEEDLQGELVVVCRNETEKRIYRFGTEYQLKDAAVLPAGSQVQDLALTADGRSLVLLNGGRVLVYSKHLQPLPEMDLGGNEPKGLEILSNGQLVVLDRADDKLRLYNAQGNLLNTVEQISHGVGRTQRIAATQSDHLALLIDEGARYSIRVLNKQFKEERYFSIPGISPGHVNCLGPAGGENLVINRGELLGALIINSKTGEVIAEIIDTSLHNSLRHPGFASGSRTAPHVFIHMGIGLLTGTYR